MRRNYSLDLLRVLSMLMVVMLHCLGHGGLIENSLVYGTANFYMSNIVYAICLVAVNCFVLLTGYFQCMTNFKLRKIVVLWGQVVFYSVGIYILLVILGVVHFSFGEFVKSFLIITMKRYWFVTAYLLLYIVSPFLNLVIHNMSRKLHLLCCIVLLAVFSFISNVIYIVDFTGINGGYSFLWFCILYIIASYFRLYVPERIRCQRYTLLAYFICCMMICGERFIAYWITPSIFGTVMLESLFYSYNSIFCTGAAIFLFQFFRGIQINNRLVRKIVIIFSPLSFAVYLIHDHTTLRPVLWELFNIKALYDSPYLCVLLVAIVLIIFMSCCFIEYIREWIVLKLKLTEKVVNICDMVQERCWKQIQE